MADPKFKTIINRTSHQKFTIFFFPLLKQPWQAQQFKPMERYTQRYHKRKPQPRHSLGKSVPLRPLWTPLQNQRRSPLGQLLLQFNPLALHLRHHRLQVCVHEFLLIITLFTEPLWKRYYGVIYILPWCTQWKGPGVTLHLFYVTSPPPPPPPPSPLYSHQKYIYILYCIMGKTFRHQPEVEHSVVLVTSRPSPLISNHDKSVLLDSSFIFSGLQSINVMLKTFTWEIHAYRTS